MKFKYSLYHYQEDVLNIFHKEVDRWDKKIHVVAPPGSWKTIMWLEMILRLGWNHLILVPNLTLQFQWKDKIEKLFLEEWEHIDEIVSIITDEIKKINIITYQSLSSSSNDNDLIMDKILNYWFRDFKNDFNDKSEFYNYVEVLKDLESKTYLEYISKYKKRFKLSKESNVENILSKKVLDYFKRLKEFKVNSIVVDEAHHLTSWWSKVIYYLCENLLDEKNSIPFIIGLTATPPYDDIDFFVLDDDYIKLLWEVDYYIPTPAIVKSWRLAPWSDLVYFVEPDDDIKKILLWNDIKLNQFIEKNKVEISNKIFSYIELNYDRLINKSYNLLINYLKFLKTYSSIDIKKYFFDEKISEKIGIEDIAKTVWKYLFEIKWKIEFKVKTKKLFYDLWYINRWNNFYKFRTPIENMLIYSKSKINWIRKVINKEISNLWNNLKLAIITDYLEEREWIINCKYILKELYDYKKYNPILVSGKWIWKLWEDNEFIEFDINILDVTKMLENWESKILIWTRLILWEWWDCPKLNTLIDLTWIVAYMSVNQVRWRAIRLDRDNLYKVSNIYDIVSVIDWYCKDIDLYRLKRKHQKFYWVSDTWLIIRWIDHIYPNLWKHISEFNNINNNMLKRSQVRDYYYKLWWIGWKYENREVFWLDIELNDIWKFIPFVDINKRDSILFFKMLKNKELLRDINNDNNTFYFELIRRFLNNFLNNIVRISKRIKTLPKKFKYELLLWVNWNFKLISNYKDELIVKRFISDVSQIFTTVIEQKYLLKFPFSYFNWEVIEKKYVFLPLPKSLSNNRSTRIIFINEFDNDNLSLSLFISWKLLYFLQKIFTKRLRLIYMYKVLFNDFNSIRKYNNWVKIIYLNNKKINKFDYIWKIPFIEAKIEKIWM